MNIENSLNGKLHFEIILGTLLIIIVFVGGANALYPDDFNSSTLNESIWTKVTPLNDATFTMIDTGAGNELLSITVPSGVSHNVWVDGNFAPRIMQSTSNEDFNIEVKFQSRLSREYQMQGIIIEQDNSNFLRFDFYGDGLNTHLFAANFTGGSPIAVVDTIISSSPSAVPIYMRVKRDGNQWTVTYSTNGNKWIVGASFIKVMNVTSVGPFVGNVNSSGYPAPAFTGLIDYFYNNFSPFTPDTTPPTITLWYGNSQRFGTLGVSQQWVNILGYTYDSSGITSLNYSLNGGTAQDLSIGPDSIRLQSSGDFNIEINRTFLLCGDNQIVITAVDNSGNVKKELITVQYSCNNVWPINYSINWSDVTNIQDVAQIVDSLWIKEQTSIRSSIIGYDRLVAIGDVTWSDYEITVPITINTPLDSSVMYGPNFGIGMRWQGHYNLNGEQPNIGWFPLGAIGAYIWVPQLNDYQLRIFGNDMENIAIDDSRKHLETGVTYMFKMKAITDRGRTLYSLKVWEQNTNEPAAWTISGYGINGELKQGSAILTTYYCNVSFGDVNIRPAPFKVDTLAPTTITHPLNLTVNEGEAATFSVVAAGTSLTYQWQKNGANITGATSSIYTTPSALLADNGYTFSVIVSNVAGSVKSNNATLTVLSIPIAPGITTHPANHRVNVGQTTTFSVVATGTELTYQWQENGANIKDATGSIYTTSALLADNGSTFSVIVSNVAGSAKSNNATLTVLSIPIAPGITIHPANQTVNVGQTTTFSVVATGTALTYQWQEKGSNITDATGSIYTTPSTSLADNGSTFSVIVSNVAGSAKSNTATLTVLSIPIAPGITTHPANHRVNVGQTTTFSVVATGTELTYQWQENGANIKDATGSIYTTSALLADNGSTFSVIVSNVAGSAKSNNATLTVLSIPIAPGITIHPANQTVNVGQMATFTVVATGTALTYQWQKNGSNITDATGSIYTTPSTSLADNGSTFSVIVSNVAGSAKSNTATLTVLSIPIAPGITTHPANQTVNVGQMATFTVVATGTALTYQWQKNGSNITDATSPSYTTSATILSDSGLTFCVNVISVGISTLSDVVTLTILPNTPTPGGKGDVNSDGQVSIVDALFVAQYTVETRTLTLPQLAAADYNGDGQVTIVDALFIAQYTVGLREL